MADTVNINTRRRIEIKLVLDGYVVIYTFVNLTDIYIDEKKTERG
jgi:hypothetical protein